MAQRQEREILIVTALHADFVADVELDRIASAPVGRRQKDLGSGKRRGIKSEVSEKKLASAPVGKIQDLGSEEFQMTTRGMKR